MEVWTIQKLLEWIAGYFGEKSVDAPRLSGEMLLSHVLGISRIELYMHFDKPVDKVKLSELRGLVKRAGEHEPVAYLIGHTEFYSLPIKVNPACLIPRPETEFLVERAIDFLRKRQGPQHVLDLCSGSGCIAVAIAKNVKDCSVIATDISGDALKVAAENVKAGKLDEKIQLLEGDLFAPVIDQLDGGKFDLIVSNPPYVSDIEYEKLAANVKDYEPKDALYAGLDGLDVYKRIADGIGEHLKDEGALLLEIGYAQGDAVRDMLQQTTLFAEIKIEKDFSNNDRVVTATRKQ